MATTGAACGLPRRRKGFIMQPVFRRCDRVIDRVAARMMRGKYSSVFRSIHIILFLALAAPGTIAVAAEPEDAGMKHRVAACSACHSPEGIQMEAGYVPRIRGKPAGYLYNQLVNYQQRRRRNRSMNHMVAHLSHAYLFEIAQYFADQRTPYPAPAAQPPAALAQRGRQLVREGDADADVPACAGCHGQRLTGVQPNTPGLVGLPRQYIMGQLGAWQVGTRHAAAPDCMAHIAGRLQGGDIAAVAVWLAAQPVPSNTRPAREPIDEPPLACGSVPKPEP